MEEMIRHPEFQSQGFTIESLCKFMNISRQGFYKRRREKMKESLVEELVIQRVLEIRHRMPRIGGKKLHYLLNKDITEIPIKIGRDKLFELLNKYGLLVKPNKQYVRTTYSKHQYRVYKNLIQEILIETACSVIVSDITYIRLEKGFCYLFLVTDLYSRKIIGYNLSETLEAAGAIKALKMSFSYIDNFNGMIHHSDRGVQYCSDEYVAMLETKGIKISMGEAGNPYENAVAERVNGILKNEFMLNTKFNNYQQARKAVSEAIETYNKLRPHMSLDYLTPDQKYAA